MDVNGSLLVTFNQANIGGLTAGTNTLRMTPYVRFGPAAANVNLLPAAHAAGQQGPLDWGCASDTNTVSAGRSLTTAIGTLPARFAPSECR